MKKIKTYIDKKLGTLDPAASCSAVQRCPKMIIPAEHIFYRNCSRFVKGLSSFCRMSDSPRHYSILIILAENYPFSIVVSILSDLLILADCNTFRKENAPISFPFYPDRVLKIFVVHRQATF